MTKRAEFTTLTKLKAMARYARCPGVFELGIECGKQFGSLSDTEFDHIMRCEIKPDNSEANCRPLCPECHLAKTTRKDALEAKKGRNIRGENKPKRKAKIQSRLERVRKKAGDPNTLIWDSEKRNWMSPEEQADFAAGKTKRKTNLKRKMNGDIVDRNTGEIIRSARR